MNKLIFLFAFCFLVFDPIRIVMGNIDLDDGQDMGRVEEVLDDENNVMERAVRSLPHYLFPDRLRNIGILRSTRSDHKIGKDSKSARNLRPEDPEYIRNDGIMRSLRSVPPESIRIVRSTRSSEPDYWRNLGIMRSTRSADQDYLRNIGIMRPTRSAEQDYLRGSGIRKSKRQYHIRNVGIMNLYDNLALRFL